MIFRQTAARSCVDRDREATNAEADLFKSNVIMIYWSLVRRDWRPSSPVCRPCDELLDVCRGCDSSMLYSRSTLSQLIFFICIYRVYTVRRVPPSLCDDGASELEVHYCLTSLTAASSKGIPTSDFPCLTLRRYGDYQTHDLDKAMHSDLPVQKATPFIMA